MSHRSESILWSSLVALVMLVFLGLSFELRQGAMYARITIISTLLFALISLALSLPRAKAPARETHTEEELASLDTVERLHALEHRAESQDQAPPFFSRDVGLVMAASFASALAWEAASFLCAGGAALLALFLAQKQPLGRSLIVAGATVAVIQYVFGNLFQIPLPSPSWWSIY